MQATITAACHLIGLGGVTRLGGVAVFATLVGCAMGCGLIRYEHRRSADDGDSTTPTGTLPSAATLGQLVVDFPPPLARLTASEAMFRGTVEMPESWSNLDAQGVELALDGNRWSALLPLANRGKNALTWRGMTRAGESVTLLMREHERIVPDLRGTNSMQVPLGLVDGQLYVANFEANVVWRVPQAPSELEVTEGVDVVLSKVLEKLSPSAEGASFAATLVPTQRSVVLFSHPTSLDFERVNVPSTLSVVHLDSGRANQFAGPSISGWSVTQTPCVVGDSQMPRVYLVATTAGPSEDTIDVWTIDLNTNAFEKSATLGTISSNYDLGGCDVDDVGERLFVYNEVDAHNQLFTVDLRDMSVSGTSLEDAPRGPRATEPFGLTYLAEPHRLVLAAEVPGEPNHAFVAVDPDTGSRSLVATLSDAQSPSGLVSVDGGTSVVFQRGDQGLSRLEVDSGNFDEVLDSNLYPDPDWVSFCPLSTNILVGVDGQGRLQRLDRETGERQYLVTQVQAPWDPKLALALACDSTANTAWVLQQESSMPALWRIDLASSAIVLIASPSEGSGTAFTKPQAMVPRDARTVLLAAEAESLPGLTSIYSVNATTRERTLLSGPKQAGNNEVLALDAMSVRELIYMAEDERLLAIARAQLNAERVDVVVSIDPSSGDRSILSGHNLGNGPLWRKITAAALTHDERLLVFGSSAVGNRSAVFAVDLDSGNRTEEVGFPVSLRSVAQAAVLPHTDLAVLRRWGMSGVYIWDLVTGGEALVPGVVHSP